MVKMQREFESKLVSMDMENVELRNKIMKMEKSLKKKHRSRSKRLADASENATPHT